MRHSGPNRSIRHPPGGPTLLPRSAHGAGDGLIAQVTIDEGRDALAG
jgi:hypothetical protein